MFAACCGCKPLLSLSSGPAETVGLCETPRCQSPLQRCAWLSCVVVSFPINVCNQWPPRPSYHPAPATQAGATVQKSIFSFRCAGWCLPLSCSPLLSTQCHHVKHLISEIVLGAQTRSANQSQKSTVSILWRRCYWVCLPFPSGKGVIATASLHRSSSENVALSEGKGEKETKYL